MTAPTASNFATIWPNLRHLYPIYCALSREFVIEMQPCRELEEEMDAPPAEAIAEAKKWFADMDQRIHIHQLRQFAQTSSQMNEEVLRDLLVHHLSKELRTDHDRDKVDFLLVQIFSQCAPSNLDDSGLSLKAVAKVLEPVVGAVEIGAPELLKPLNDLLQDASRTVSLKALFTSRIIERGRELKASCGEKFFNPLTMVAFARFGFLIRRTFFRLMHKDLNEILDGLRELESRGVTTLDCRKAQFAVDEPITRLRTICQSWKVMFHAEYSSGQPLCILVDLRTAVEAALSQSTKPARPQAKSVAAGAKSAASNSHAPEFEVSAGSTTGDADAARIHGSSIGRGK
jgi:hypothetical protein